MLIAASLMAPRIGEKPGRGKRRFRKNRPAPVHSRSLTDAAAGIAIRLGTSGANPRFTKKIQQGFTSADQDGEMFHAVYHLPRSRRALLLAAAAAGVLALMMQASVGDLLA